MTNARDFSAVFTAILALSIGCSGANAAGSASTSFGVSANVQTSCAVSASSLSFGSYVAASASANDATSTITVTCTSGLTYTVALDGGTNTGTVNARAMTDGSSHNLTYALYTGSGRTTMWGDGTLSTQTVGGTGNGSAQPLTVYGRIPTAQFVNSGSYTDTVNVTVNY